MAGINKEGYVARRTKGGKRNPNGKGSLRDWYLIKSRQTGAYFSIGNGMIVVPKHLLGRRVRLKLEFIS